jgi:hypothetical protein
MSAPVAAASSDHAQPSLMLTDGIGAADDQRGSLLHAYPAGPAHRRLLQSGWTSVAPAGFTRRSSGGSRVWHSRP